MQKVRRTIGYDLFNVKKKLLFLMWPDYQEFNDKQESTFYMSSYIMDSICVGQHF